MRKPTRGSPLLKGTFWRYGNLKRLYEVSADSDHARSGHNQVWALTPMSTEPGDQAHSHAWPVSLALP